MMKFGLQTKRVAPAVQMTPYYQSATSGTKSLSDPNSSIKILAIIDSI